MRVVAIKKDNSEEVLFNSYSDKAIKEYFDKVQIGFETWLEKYDREPISDVIASENSSVRFS